MFGVDIFMKRSKKLVSVIAVIVIAAVISGIIYIADTNKFSDWETAPGIITEIEIMRKLKDKIHYTYTVDGNMYSGSELVNRASVSSGRKVGDEVSIWFDPNNPSSSFYLQPNPTFQALAPFFLAVPICIIVVRKEQY